MSWSLLFALACAIGAIAYGVVSIKWIMAKPTGNDRMREIAAAVEQGASAYLSGPPPSASPSAPSCRARRASSA